MTLALRLCLAFAASAAALSPAHATTRLPLVRGTLPSRRSCAVHLSSAEETGGDADVDWRELRARLVAQEKASQDGELASVDASSGFVYESPLIEQGSVILGGTEQEFGFALRQQYFHKCVMLLLQHDTSFTKGIILNRPSAYNIDGWRVWFGGDVAEGGMFRGEKDAVGAREVICLHALEGVTATRLSMEIIKGVSYTTLEGARSLVASGEADQADFWVFVGYAGWAPKQLEGEVARDSWFLASADSGTLLRELLRQGTELPPPSSGVAPPGDGLATYEKLMESIGRVAEVERTRGCLADKMLREWARVRLAPPTTPAADSGTEGDGGDGGLPTVRVGTVLRSGSPADRYLLSDQFLHKALMVVVHELSDGVAVCVVLNRPTANLVEFHTEGKPRRCISFGGDGRMRGGALDIDSNGLLWLAQAATIGDGADAMGSEIGDSGLRRVPALEAAESIKDGAFQLSDFLLVSGLVCFEPDELRVLMRADELGVVDDARSLWPQVWGLADARGVEEDAMDSESGGALLSDGTGVWWAAAQLENRRRDAAAPRQGSAGGDVSLNGGDSASAPAEGRRLPGEGDGLSALLEGLQAMPPAHLADEALDEWLKFFAGHASQKA